MEYPLETLKLVTFDKNNLEHMLFLKSLRQDESIKERFQGIAANLLHPTDRFWGNSYFVKDKDTLVGFLNIGNYNIEEKSVYLRGATLKGYRGMGYGKKFLKESTDYIFNNYLQVESIRLVIARDNIASLKTAEDCGYTWLNKDIYIAYNPNLRKDLTL